MRGIFASTTAPVASVTLAVPCLHLLTEPPIPDLSSCQSVFQIFSYCKVLFSFGASGSAAKSLFYLTSSFLAASASTFCNFLTHLLLKFVSRFLYFVTLSSSLRVWLTTSLQEVALSDAIVAFLEVLTSSFSTPTIHLPFLAYFSSMHFCLCSTRMSSAASLLGRPAD